MANHQCFVSYSRSDNELRTILAIIHYLQKESANSIEFLIDEGILPGDDLNKFMKRINSVEAVLVFMSPEYKRKVDARIDSGVYTEYRYIVDRQNSFQRSKIGEKESPTFALIPIIISGSFSHSCPNHMKAGSAIDFTDFYIQKNGKMLPTIATRYKKIFKRIVTAIKVIESINNEDVKAKISNTLEHLFRDTKFQGISKEETDLYVKTKAYKTLKTQGLNFFLGRKGSGKSTLGPLLYTLDNERFKDHIEINVELLRLDNLLNLIIDNSLEKDIGILITFSKYFIVVWEILIYLKCFDVIIKEKKSGKLDKDQKKYLTPIERFMTQYKTDVLDKIYSKNIGKPDSLNAYFQASCAVVNNQVENAIRKARTDDPHFYFDMSLGIERYAIVYSAIPPDVLNAFYEIVSRCKRSFLISFDGFDTMFERFRVESNNRNTDPDVRIKRTALETGFLEGFLDLIMEMKSRKQYNPFYKVVHVCVTVPKDRFFEVKDNQRDSYRFINDYQEIMWSGIELSIMLRKRLEALREVNTERSLPPEERLAAVIKDVIPSLPKESEIQIGDKNFRKELFLNVLRHTFWRPREVLIYYYKILIIVEDLERRKIIPDNFAISKIISDTTFDIIKTEFLKEFENYCTNLKQIIGEFKGANQIISYAELEECIGKCDFQFIHKLYPVKDFNEKIDFLYEIGFLGLEVGKKHREMLRLLHGEAFSFITGTNIYEHLRNNYAFQDCNFIIHPIFCEYLGLDTTSQGKLTIDITWDYLRQQEVFG